MCASHMTGSFVSWYLLICKATADPRVGDEKMEDPLAEAATPAAKKLSPQAEMKVIATTPGSYAELVPSEMLQLWTEVGRGIDSGQTGTLHANVSIAMSCSLWSYRAVWDIHSNRFVD